MPTITPSFVVTSAIHGDVAAFKHPQMAVMVAHRMNTKLFDEMVYHPLAAVEFVISFDDETRLNRAYREAEYTVVEVHTTKV